MANEELENYVIETLNNFLNLPCAITESEIDICHSLSSNKGKNPIIIKFVRRSSRNLVFNHKKDLKHIEGPKMAITESLTKRRLMPVNEARKVFSFQNVWTTKGEVYVKFRGKKYQLFDFPDMEYIRFRQTR